MIEERDRQIMRYREAALVLAMMVENPSEFLEFVKKSDQAAKLLLDVLEGAEGPR